jgi:membrane protein YqaA with SNARE-associated domain
MELGSRACRWLALPQFGLSTLFVVSLVSATLLPLGSEPAVFGLVRLNPELFWPADHRGNDRQTPSAARSVSTWATAPSAPTRHVTPQAPPARQPRAMAMLERFGAPACC